ncbi:MAG TPA: transketolase [Geminicoccaceae bacterium]|nr:transketolase [Geminicoccaceae bacterium]
MTAAPTSDPGASDRHEPVPEHGELANAIRALAMDAVQAANSGHPGMPMGMADVATVLFGKFLRFDPSAPDWPDRDRFVLSAGHGSMLLYALLHLTGYPEMEIEQLKRFRQLGSRTAGHPEHGHAPGIETTTGPLGQGLANAVGMALAERHLRARFGAGLVDHRTYAIVSDGDLMEGISHEACELAGHQRLDRLTLLFDDNHISIDGSTELASSSDQLRRFEAYGWRVERIDGQDPAAIEAALAAAQSADRPSLIACRTTIGYGAPTKAGTAATHGSPLGPDEIAGAREKLGWPHPPFEIPEPIRAAWRGFGSRGAAARGEWQDRLAAQDAALRAEFERAQAGALPEGLDRVLQEHKARLVEEKPSWATRKASQEALEVFTAAVPELIGGSADLTGSVNTKTKMTVPATPANPGGRYLHYGVREHAMAAAMNGMALHKGVIPYGGTFLVFSDYCRPAIRLAALMGQRVIFVLTHDSIGLGEDGPTHQPVEHLAALRAIPNLAVFRPADAVETAECWALALVREDGPSAMVLTRQNLPALRTTLDHVNRSAQGAYVLIPAEGRRAVTLLATGSEVALARDARTRLQAYGVGCALVSMPCFELFDQQDLTYRKEVLGSGLRIAVEAASPFGWTRYVRSEDDVVGMRGFGASGPYEELYKHFGITAERIVDLVRRRF